MLRFQALQIAPCPACEREVWQVFDASENAYISPGTEDPSEAIAMARALNAPSKRRGAAIKALRPWTGAIRGASDRIGETL